MNVIVSKITDGKKFNCYGQEIIQCRICGNGTIMLGTKLCDRCWELKARISRDFDIAVTIINDIKNKKVISKLENDPDYINKILDDNEK